MTIKKDWYKSQTILSAIGLFILLVNKQFGFVVVEAEVLAFLYSLTEVLLVLSTIHGRLTAKTEIKGI